MPKNAEKWRKINKKLTAQGLQKGLKWYKMWLQVEESGYYVGESGTILEQGGDRNVHGRIQPHS